MSALDVENTGRAIIFAKQKSEIMTVCSVRGQSDVPKTDAANNINVCAYVIWTLEPRARTDPNKNVIL